MATEVNTAMQNHVMTEFWGGDDRGMCVQITSKNIQLRDTAEEQLRESEGYIQLTMEEAAALCEALGGFIQREAVRRQKSLRDELEDRQADQYFDLSVITTNTKVQY